ncbi:prefoldin subunit 3 [Drosophila tropicalis]|uniref:prefoldin subunit 3 n=1 Tax=Drosophila tropicalis TaxID=46794 RepID=UPI0035ABD563
MFAFIDKIEKPPLHKHQKSFGNIEESKFINDIEAYLCRSKFGKNVDSAMSLENAKYAKYGQQAMQLEHNYTNQTIRIETAKSNLQLVGKFMKDKTEFEAKFHPAIGVFTTVIIPPLEKVTLLVGSDVFMEFELKDAEKHLIKQIKDLVQQLKAFEHDIEYLREMMTITELNISTLYKYSLQQPKKRQKQGSR